MELVITLSILLPQGLEDLMPGCVVLGTRRKMKRVVVVVVVRLHLEQLLLPQRGHQAQVTLKEVLPLKTSLVAKPNAGNPRIGLWRAIPHIFR
jgi:hypothetical protein